MASAEGLRATEGNWQVNLLGGGMCIFWVASYIAMIYRSFADRTYSMALMPLCCNIACEFVYVVVHPIPIPAYWYIFVSWLLVDCVVAFAAMKFAPNEWKNAPLVYNNLSWIFTASVAGWMTAHSALVHQFGTLDAAAWSSWFCQLFLSAGCLCQLIARGSSRGTSLFIWFTRFVGTVFALPHEILRHQYGYSNVAWHCPLGWWGGMAFFLLDGLYGLVLWFIQKSERADDSRHRRTGSRDQKSGGIQVQ